MRGGMYRLGGWWWVEDVPWWRSRFENFFGGRWRCRWRKGGGIDGVVMGRGLRG